MKFKWWVHEDFRDNEREYIDEVAMEQLGRVLTDDECRTITDALYELCVEVDLETGEVSLLENE